jgi:mannose-6-phosphate isomerase-like protein (cupin superfamily)
MNFVFNKVNLSSKLAKIHEHWKPHIAGELNGQLIKLVKFQGEFIWHHHDHEDEMFLVVKGRFRMEFRDDAGEGVHSTPSLHSVAQGRPRGTRTVSLSEGEFIVVPRGVEHKPVADEECWVMLFEPASTLNTGNVVNGRTVHELKRV